jgi:hypothetical protein
VHKPPKSETVRFRADAGTNDAVENAIFIVNQIAPGTFRGPSDFWRLAGTVFLYGLGILQPNDAAAISRDELSIDTSTDVD